MQTQAEQKAANRARMGTYYRRCSQWLQSSPDTFSARIRKLEARYCQGIALQRLWRAARLKPKEAD